MLDQMPVVDMTMDSREFNGKIMRGLHEIGFGALSAPVLAAKLSAAYKIFGEFFSLPSAVKTGYAHPELSHQRGWTPPYTEKPIACRGKGPGGVDLADAKEIWAIGPQIARDHPLVQQYPEIYAANIWPHQVPALEMIMTIMYGEMLYYGRTILGAVAQELGKPAKYFDDMIESAPHMMRALHYLPIAADQVGKVVWACNHTDINLLTILPAASRPGLWIRRRDGQMIPGTAPQGHVIFQVADMLDYLTGGQLMSAAHEVRAPEEATAQERYSAALFIHARSDVILEPQVRGSNAALYPPINAGEMLRQRLKAIGLA